MNAAEVSDLLPGPSTATEHSAVEPGGPLRAAAGTALRLIWTAAPGPTLGYLAGSIVAGLLVPASAWLLAQLIGRVAAHAPSADLLGYAIGFAGCGALTVVVAQGNRYAQAELARRTRRRAKAELMTAVTAIPALEQLEQPEFADRLRLAQQSGLSAPLLLLRSGFGGGQALVSATGFVIALLAVAPWAAAAALAGCLPPVAAAARENRARARGQWQTSPGLRREFAYAALLTDIRAAKETRLHASGEFLRERMLAEIARTDEVERRLDRRSAWTQTALAGLGALLVGGAVIWSVVLAARGHLDVAALSVVIAALSGLQAGARSVVQAWADGHGGLLGFQHYQRILALSAAATRAGAAATRAGATRDLTIRPVPPLRDGIEFRDVWFGYGGAAPVLRGVDLTIPAGRSVALVGANGAGKSTIIKLLCGLYRPTRGAIYWDGVDLSEFDPAALRRRIGALFQDFMQYELTATDNIGIGDLRRLADPVAIRSAARAARVDHLLSGLPRGYATTLSRLLPGIGEDSDLGTQLSGGQWQRVAIARALLRSDAELFVLDEPSSGLDADAEAEIHAQLRKLTGRTRVLITHRLSAVRHADRIVVVGDGKIIEAGTHTALLAAGGEYARLFALQAAGYIGSEVSVDELTA